MFRRFSLFVFVLSASVVFGQLDSNSVTVTASRNVNLQADQSVFGVYIDSGINTSLDDVIAALQGSGITVANFSGVSTVPNYLLPPDQQMQLTLEWAFGLAAPLAKTKDT